MTVVNSTESGLLGAIGSIRQIDTQIATVKKDLTSSVSSRISDSTALSFSSRFQTKVLGFTDAVRTAASGITLTQVAVSGIDNVVSGLKKIQDLSTSAAASTTSTAKRNSLQSELDDIVSDISKIVGKTRFDDKSLLNQSQSLEFSLESGGGEKLSLSTTDLNSVLDSLEALDITTQAGAKSALSDIETANDSFSTQRATFTELGSALEIAIDELESGLQLQSKSFTNEFDEEYATRISLRIQNALIDNETLAQLAQANADDKSVVKLLL